MSDRPLFFLINSYTTGLSPLTMKYILDLHVTSRFGGRSESGELGLKVTQTQGFLPCGASARWVADKKEDLRGRNESFNKIRKRIVEVSGFRGF